MERIFRVVGAAGLNAVEPKEISFVFGKEHFRNLALAWFVPATAGVALPNSGGIGTDSESIRDEKVKVLKAIPKRVCPERAAGPNWRAGLTLPPVVSRTSPNLLFLTLRHSAFARLTPEPRLARQPAHHDQNHTQSALQRI